MGKGATNRTQTYYDLRDALDEPGCPVCRLRARSVDECLDPLLYENVNDPGVRHDVREARGFCHRHAWQLVRPSASLGAAILHHGVIKTVLGILEEAKFQAPPPARGADERLGTQKLRFCVRSSDPQSLEHAPRDADR